MTPTSKNVFILKPQTQHPPLGGLQSRKERGCLPTSQTVIHSFFWKGMLDFRFACQPVAISTQRAAEKEEKVSVSASTQRTCSWGLYGTIDTSGRWKVSQVYSGSVSVCFTLRLRGKTLNMSTMRKQQVDVICCIYLLAGRRDAVWCLAPAPLQHFQGKTWPGSEGWWAPPLVPLGPGPGTMNDPKKYAFAQ